MNVVKDPRALSPNEKIDACVTLGMFDGVHLGHLYLLRRLRETASTHKAASVLISFYPHPSQILRFRDSDFLINTEEERIEKIAQSGSVDWLYFLRYDNELRNMLPEEFIEKKILPLFSIKAFVMGHDSKFGKDRAGDISTLKSIALRHRFEVVEINEFFGGGKISSTQIRTAIKSHKIQEANDMLGYPYFLRGIVIKGDGRGQKIGFPTANLSLKDKAKLIPADGVYAIKVKIGKPEYERKSFWGMMNIGIRPTFDTSKMERTIEAHILDFSDTIYDAPIETELYAFLRHEIKFSGTEGLVNQLRLDKERVKKMREESE